MKLNEYKLVLVTLGLIGILLIASPTITNALHLSSKEPFSALYLLGPGQMAAHYPFNVRTGLNYSVYVGVSNNLGSSAYYVLYVKLANESDPLPDGSLGTPSPIQPLYEQQLLIENNQNWVGKVSFTFSDTHASANQAFVGKLTVNNAVFEVNKPANWNSSTTGFYYKVFFELWRYNVPSGTVQYDDRFVTLRLNLTATQ